MGALLLGFIFAPSSDLPVESSYGGTESAGATSTAGERTNRGDGSSNAAETRVPSSSNNPVVVRVQIDSGDGGSVEFESGGMRSASVSPVSPVAPVTPKMPEYFEPLQPLELPPPPSMDLTVDDPVPSIPNRGRYEEPPPSGDAISDYRLEGIFWSPADPGAIINDEIVSPGSRVDQLRVLEIQKDHVLVQLHGRTYDLR